MTGFDLSEWLFHLSCFHHDLIERTKEHFTVRWDWRSGKKLTPWVNTAGFPDSSISSTSPSVTDRPARMSSKRALGSSMIEKQKNDNNEQWSFEASLSKNFSHWSRVGAVFSLCTFDDNPLALDYNRSSHHEIVALRQIATKTQNNIERRTTYRSSNNDTIRWFNKRQTERRVGFSLSHWFQVDAEFELYNVLDIRSLHSDRNSSHRWICVITSHAKEKESKTQSFRCLLFSLHQNRTTSNVKLAETERDGSSYCVVVSLLDYLRFFDARLSGCSTDGLFLVIFHLWKRGKYKRVESMTDKTTSMEGKERAGMDKTNKDNSKGTWVFRIRKSAVRQAFSFPSCSSSVSIAKVGSVNKIRLFNDFLSATHFSIVVEHR